VSRKAIQAEGLHWEKEYRGNDLHGENGQVLAGADDLIQLIGRKVIVGKNITT
jgi:hypothetical protein